MASNTRLVAFFNVAHFVDHYFLLIFPTAVLGMGADFGWSYGELLALSLGSFIAFGAGSLPAGWLGDHWSRRNMMIVFLLGIGAATIVTGFSATPVMLAVNLTALGIFSSIYHPIANAMLAASAAGDRLGRVMGLNGVFGNLGVAASALATGAITYWLGWRWAFILPGAVAMVLGVAFWALVPDGVGRAAKGAGRKLDAPRDVLIRVFAVLALVVIAGSLIFQSATVSVPKLVQERAAGLAGSTLGVGLLASAIFTVGAMTQLVVGRLVDRISLKTSFLLVSAFSAPCLLAAAFATDWAMVLAGAGIMVAIFGQVTINDTMLGRYSADAWRSRIYAVRYFLGFVTAGAAVPLVSYLHDHAGGFATVYLVLSVMGVFVFLGALLFPADRPKPAARLAAAE
jgi:MFS family permease